ncbi:MAG: hypothetical protein PHP13_03295 [Methanomicrobium sp.]|nr:hypothetical protein [Methanomicrobium sp.]MDD4299581.1 hypothetical protein [Methanomicrobium sp.]
MIKKASELEESESGVVENISGFKPELECMGISKGCKIAAVSKKCEKVTVISEISTTASKIIILDEVASKISVNTSDLQK